MSKLPDYPNEKINNKYTSCRTTRYINPGNMLTPVVIDDNFGTVIIFQNKFKHQLISIMM